MKPSSTKPLRVEGVSIIQVRRSTQHAPHGGRVKNVRLIIYLFFVCLNICRGPHLQMSPKRFTMAATALFSAWELTRCALVARVSELVTVARS